MSSGDSASRSPRLEAAANRMRIDAATAEVLKAFRTAGVQALVLKGPSLIGWLYSPDEAHSYADSDLLVRPSQERAAGEVLRELGFELDRDDTRMPEWWLEHDAPWFRAQDSVWIDLHRYLDGVGVDPETAWTILAGSAETIPLAATEVPALGLPARLLNVVLHAAQHGQARGTAMVHVERALTRVDQALWREAAPGALHRVAAEHGVRFIVSGGNYATEGILPRAWHYNAKDVRFLKAVNRRFGRGRLKTFPTFGFVDEAYFKLLKRIRFVYILNLVPYSKTEAMRKLQEELGWEDYGGKHYESKITGFVQSYILPVKFHIDYRRATLSSQICAG